VPANLKFAEVVQQRSIPDDENLSIVVKHRFRVFSKILVRLPNLVTFATSLKSFQKPVKEHRDWFSGEFGKPSFNLEGYQIW